MLNLPVGTNAPSLLDHIAKTGHSILKSRDVYEFLKVFFPLGARCILYVLFELCLSLRISKRMARFFFLLLIVLFEWFDHLIGIRVARSIAFSTKTYTYTNWVYSDNRRNWVHFIEIFRIFSTMGLELIKHMEIEFSMNFTRTNENHRIYSGHHNDNRLVDMKLDWAWPCHAMPCHVMPYNQKSKSNGGTMEW